MLTRGFSMLNNGDAPVVVNTPTKPIEQSVPAQSTTMTGAYNSAVSNAIPKYTQSTTTSVTRGGAGVQFGAFASMSAAQTHAGNIKSKIGVTAVVEPNGSGLYRVRVYGVSDAEAQKIKASATAHGIDSYVFH
jgi:cell division protein FtsN